MKLKVAKPGGKAISFCQDPDSGFAFAEKMTNPDGVLMLRYVEPPVVEEITKRCTKRVLVNTRRQTRENRLDEDQFIKELLTAAVEGWKFTKKSLVCIQAKIDFSEIGEHDEIPFNADNLEILGAKGVSALSLLVQLILGDYALWFGVKPPLDEEDDGAEEDAAKNSVNGPPGNTDGSVVRSASSATPRLTNQSAASG